MVSSVFTEFNYNWTFDGPNKNEWTDEETMANLTDKFGEEYAQKIADEFQKVFPGSSAGRCILLLWIRHPEPSDSRRTYGRETGKSNSSLL